jgi:hypothetical protein
MSAYFKIKVRIYRKSQFFSFFKARFPFAVQVNHQAKLSWTTFGFGGGLK